MINLDNIEIYCNQHEHFRNNESASEILSKTPQDTYFCVRLDGIGMSKRFLKDELTNRVFFGQMWEALESTYDVLHRKTPEDTKNIILGALICADEVSIIFNSNKNYFDGKIFKTVTTVSSTFSSFFTGHGFSKFNSQKKSKKNKLVSGAFDGRPLIFSSENEIRKYFLYRYSLYVRNSMAKVLRLNNVAENLIYGPDYKNNIPHYWKLICEKDLNEQIEKTLKYIVAFFVDSNQTLQSYKTESDIEFAETLSQNLFLNADSRDKKLA